LGAAERAASTGARDGRECINQSQVRALRCTRLFGGLLDEGTFLAGGTPFIDEGLDASIADRTTSFGDRYTF